MGTSPNRKFVVTWQDADIDDWGLFIDPPPLGVDLTFSTVLHETTDVIEKLCIEAALELTKNNRASAAEMLGLSRQSLYSKLHRFGLSGPDDEDDE